MLRCCIVNQNSSKNLSNQTIFIVSQAGFIAKFYNGCKKPYITASNFSRSQV